jgi:hypothetical protein
MVEYKKQYLKSRFNISPLESSPSIIATVSSKVKISDAAILNDDVINA